MPEQVSDKMQISATFQVIIGGPLLQAPERPLLEATEEMITAMIRQVMTTHPAAFITGDIAVVCSMVQEQEDAQ
jgi:hypothetical protein